jgi:hypothetical protein
MLLSLLLALGLLLLRVLRVSRLLWLMLMLSWCCCQYQRCQTLCMQVPLLQPC